MTTTPIELGEMLITGKPMEESSIHHNPEWVGMAGDRYFNLDNFNYRLKPVTTYYRVMKMHTGSLAVESNYEPFLPMSELGDLNTLIHDFEKEES